MMTVGGWEVKLSADIRAAEHLDQFVADDLHDLLSRTQALQHFLADGFLSDGVRELLDDLEVDVRFKQRHADFLERLFDVLLGVSSSLAAKILEDAL